MMKKFLSLVLIMTFICSMLNLTVYAADGYNICDAEEAYRLKIEELKKNKNFYDAYMVDVYNNKKPVLCTIIKNDFNSMSGGFESWDYEFYNDNLNKLNSSVDDPVAYDCLVFSYGSSGYAGHGYLAIDKNNKVYTVKYTRSVNGRLNNTDTWASNAESDNVYKFFIGYYEGHQFYKLYENEVYRCNNGTQFTVKSIEIDKSGSKSSIEFANINDNDAILKHYGLTKMMVEYSGKWPDQISFTHNKGSDLKKYTCTPSDWAKPLIDEAIAYGIVPENLQHLYKSKISRGEFCQLICALIERTQGKSLFDIINERGGYNFRDDSPAPFDKLSENYTSMTDYLKSNSPIALCEKAGIINGYSEGNLAPDDFLTRQQAAVILERTLQYLGFGESNTSAIQFNDASSFASWATNSIDLISACAVPDSDTRIMSGDANGNFKPEDNFTIEQAIITTKRTLDYIRVPLVRWIQDGKTKNELMSTLVFEDKYQKCKVFDNLTAANNFQYDDLTMNTIRYLNSPDTMFSDMFYYACYGDNKYVIEDQPEELKEQLALIISEITSEDDAQNTAEIKVYNNMVAKILKFGADSTKLQFSEKAQKYIGKAQKISGKIETLIDWTNFGIEQIEYITHDYVESMLYLDTIREAIEVTNCDSDLLDNAIYQLSEDYHGWWVNNICEKIAKDVKDEFTSGAVNVSFKSLLGSYSVFVYAVPLAMEVSGINKNHVGSKNVMLSLSYSNMLIAAYKEIAQKIADDNYTAEDVAHCERLFELCKAAKINEYENLLSATDDESISNDPWPDRDLQTVKLIKMIDKPIISLSGASTSNPVNFLKKEIEALKKLSYN